jgi:hypothetical protein
LADRDALRGSIAAFQNPSRPLNEIAADARSAVDDDVRAGSIEVERLVRGAVGAAFIVVARDERRGDVRAPRRVQLRADEAAAVGIDTNRIVVPLPVVRAVEAILLEEDGQLVGPVPSCEVTLRLRLMVSHLVVEQATVRASRLSTNALSRRA